MKKTEDLKVTKLRYLELFDLSAQEPNSTGSMLVRFIAKLWIHMVKDLKLQFKEDSINMRGL